MTEYDIQRTFVENIERLNPDLLLCATVGGARMSINQAKKIKRQGYRKGIPDLIIYEPRGGYYGLFIEIKKKGGRPSPHQKKWVDDLQSRGYRAAVCKGLDQCIDEFNHYFNLDKGVKPIYLE